MSALRELFDNRGYWWKAQRGHRAVFPMKCDRIYGINIGRWFIGLIRGAQEER